MRTVPYPHPGGILQEEFLAPLGITATRLAKAIGVPQTRIGKILACRRSITADTALWLARDFGTSGLFWLNSQVAHDAAQARDTLEGVLESITRTTGRREAAWTG